MSVLLSLSNSHLFWQGREPEPIEKHHRPFFLAFPQDPHEPIGKAHARLVALVGAAQGRSPDEDPLAKALEVHEPIQYRSFWNHGQHRMAIPVVARRPFWIPDISEALFFTHGFYTCEHDIPYTERANADLAAEKGWWLLDTRGQPNKLNVMTYDIETTQYGKGPAPPLPTRPGAAAPSIPIDIIGYSHFDLEYSAAKDLDTEQFDFQFRHLPNDWAEREVVQLTSRNLDEELDHLQQFTEHAVKQDIIAGHNILGFDNKQIHDRLVELLQKDQRRQTLSPKMREWFQRFTNVHSRPDRSFHFGTSQDIATWHPITLDTFHAARKFFFFHDDFTLKGLAPWLGINVPDRLYLESHEMGLDAKTLLYNKHDVQEQMGITQMLIAQALPLCFTVNLPLDDLLTGGNTKMWDHMAFIRARRQRRFMPATSRAQAIARAVQRVLPRTPFPTREQVSEAVRQLPPEERATSANKEIVRVAKQGPEMPFWCEHPGVIVKADPTTSGDPDDPNGYAIPGGMTLKPDSELKSHFVPWYHVVAADVGAMYPTILKARNLTADTVRPARAGETPDDWIWLFELDEVFASSGRYVVKKADAADKFTKGKGWLIGVKHSGEPGMVNLAMTGILSTIQKVKDERARAKKEGRPKDAIRILDMTYQSLKAARNAGTHGILVAVNVSCRQFNVWGGANITTIGQKILHDTLTDWEGQGIRVVYGDTDGIYMGCSKSAGNIPHFAEALGADVEPQADKWITMPDQALAAVAAANKKWRDELQYEGFELEAETHDAMVFVVHKNYLIFDANPKGDGILLETKGNNFKASDKAPLTQEVMRNIMARALREVSAWDSEEKAREAMKTAIKKATREVMGTIQVAKTERRDLILRQSVGSIKSYEPNPDGTLRSQAVRTAALEDLLGEPITSTRKMRFIVCKTPLPLYTSPDRQQAKQQELARSGHQLVVKEPKNRGLKPIEYMWPVERVDPAAIDWVWYKSMVEDYVKGAFGFDSLELVVQRDLSSWF
ncbi:MAG TPA: DNA polymerase elongation subunit (family B) [Candidatus Thermoplasmatota archaeon]|nr:DNA polymerase elongation subunit (family B) [Candidatus Thermoplasmatota archaeon]